MPGMLLKLGRNNLLNWAESMPCNLIEFVVSCLATWVLCE